MYIDQLIKFISDRKVYMKKKHITGIRRQRGGKYIVKKSVA